MYESIGGFRSHTMERIRNVVETHYCFGDAKNHHEKVAALLHGDDFTFNDDDVGCSSHPLALLTSS